MAWGQPIGCGGVAVFPDDVVVVDDDGAVVIPAALVDDVVAQALDQERLEEWIMGEVAHGAALPGLYPPNAENLARYGKPRKSRFSVVPAAGGGLIRVRLELLLHCRGMRQGAGSAAKRNSNPTLVA